MCCPLNTQIKQLSYDPNVFHSAIFQMISLEIHIQNLSPVNGDRMCFNNSTKITLRIGALQTDISMQGEGTMLWGGKRMILDINQEELKSYFKVYALGLFMQNLSGRYWSLMSLQPLQIGSLYSFSKLYFYNDDRHVYYVFDFRVQLSSHHPKPLQKEIMALLKDEPDRSISFLHGKQKTTKTQYKKQQKELPDKAVPIRKVNKVDKKGEERQHLKKEHDQMNFFDELAQNVYLPPTIEFTNDEPRIDLTKSHRSSQLIDQDYKQSPQFVPMQTTGGRSSKNWHEKQNEIRKKMLRDLARMEAQKQVKKREDQIMVPVPSQTGAYKLVPLSKMSEAQIVEYAEKQKIADKYKQIQNQRRIKQQRSKQKKAEKQQLIGKIENEQRKQILKQKIGYEKFSEKERISQKNKQSSSNIQSAESEVEVDEGKGKNIWVKPKYNEDKFDEQKDDEQEYEPDFDSVSNGGSQLRSKISLQSSISISQDKERKKINESDISESMNDYDYSQDFESFSQSLASRNKRGSSISEISGSYASTSNRKL